MQIYCRKNGLFFALSLMIFATGLLNCLKAKTPSLAAGKAPTTIEFVFPSRGLYFWSTFYFLTNRLFLFAAELSIFFYFTAPITQCNAAVLAVISLYGATVIRWKMLTVTTLSRQILLCLLFVPVFASFNPTSFQNWNYFNICAINCFTIGWKYGRGK